MTDINGEKFDTLIAPVVFGDKKVGYISVNIPRSHTIQKVLETAKLLALSGLLILALIGLLSYVLIVHLTKPLLVTARILDKIADEGGDLTQRLSVR